MKLLDRLENVKATSQNSYMAKCPAHDDRRPSLSIRKCPDGIILLHCFAGCHVEEVLAAVDLNFGDLFPDGPLAERKRPGKPSFSILAATRLIGFEGVLIALAAERIAAGIVLGDDDRNRVSLAAARIRGALNVVA